MKGFEELFAINVNEKTEEKNGLTYLSWAWAWAEFKKVYPDATYKIKRFANDLPYIYEENVGYMVFTEVTAGGLTYEMWLPVMDGANKAMKREQYSYFVKKLEWDAGARRKIWQGEYDEKTVEAATMMDINKTIMRCLVKNLAMFGLGLYIYAGEDLPEALTDEKAEDPKAASKPTKATPKKQTPRERLIAKLDELGINKADYAKEKGLNPKTKPERYEELLKELEGAKND